MLVGGLMRTVMRRGACPSVGRGGWVVVLLIGRVAAVGQRSVPRRRLLFLELRLVRLPGSKCGIFLRRQIRGIFGDAVKLASRRTFAGSVSMGLVDHAILAILLLPVLGRGCSGIGIVDLFMVTWPKFAGTLSRTKRRYKKRPTVHVRIGLVNSSCFLLLI